MNAVGVRDLVVLCGERRLVGPVSFEIACGTRVGLRGPSGAGKSTILRALVGLLAPELCARGRIDLLGCDLAASRAKLPALRARAVLVGQTPVIFPASIIANAVFGVRHAVRASSRELRARGEAALVEAGLWEEVADRLDAPASDLSVGQRQRLCLARALALDPELLLLDEPTSALDAKAMTVSEAAIGALESKRTILIVSHDASQLARLCDRVLELRGDGLIAPAPESLERSEGAA